MVYAAEKPILVPSSDELRSRIPGWGVDLHLADEPQDRLDPGPTGAHWHMPDQQPEVSPRERSIEHQRLTPVFGTSAPTKGVSGAMRRYAYRRFSEARAAHWILLLGADRVDAWESHLRSFVTTRPDNPVTQTGVLGEFKHHGFASRVGVNRADLKHQWLDPIVVGGPWVFIGLRGYRGLKKRVTRLRGA